jgi:hypothetical protein
MTDIEYSKYKPGDEAQILELHHRVFNSDYTLDYWKWHFRDNPSPDAQIWLALLKGKCVGHYALMPMSLWVGEEISVFQSLISMIHPDYQRRGILKGLESVAGTNLAGKYPMYTFLNHNSYDVYTKRFGWEYMGDVPIYVRLVNTRLFGERHPLLKILNPLCLLYQNFFSGFGRRLYFTEFSDFDEDLENLWLRNRERLGITFNRSQPWFQWRYSKGPIEYIKYKILDEGRVVGYLVLRYQPRFGFKFGWILDILVDDEPGKHLFSRTLQSLALESALQCDILSLLLPNCTYRTDLHRAGFFRLPKRILPHPFYFCVRPYDYRNKAFEDITKWYLSWSLHDAL